MKRINRKFSAITVLACIIVSAFWAFVPFLGWSHYTLEGANISCSIGWRSRSFNVLSYNLTVFLFVYIIPIAVLILTNIKIIFLVINLVVLNNFEIKIKLF